MRTEVVGPLRGTTAGAIAEDVIGSCVHCGMCNSACPTFRLTGDELDGPRGRIYLLKQALEGEPVGKLSQNHLDRCLECRACETACPSGVEYHRLLDIGRPIVAAAAPRPMADRDLRWLVRLAAAHPAILSTLFALGRMFRPLVPSRLAGHLPPARAPGAWPSTRHSRKMMILGGCVQSAAARRFNAATARVFDRLGVHLVERSGCCGAVPFHLDASKASKATAQRQIDAFASALNHGFEAILVNASGCAAFMRDWPDLFADDLEYAEKARHVVAHLKDPIEVLAEASLSPRRAPVAGRIAVHDPCTLRNGPGLGGKVAALLTGLGYQVHTPADEGMCCGSAGTYSLFQRELAERLREDKIAALTAGEEPQAIFTGNIGCWMHLSAASPVPVRHWIEAVDDLIW
jgi:glycolate oxidase iron-sulfur subunit